MTSNLAKYRTGELTNFISQLPGPSLWFVRTEKPKYVRELAIRVAEAISKTPVPVYYYTPGDQKGRHSRPFLRIRRPPLVNRLGGGKVMLYAGKLIIPHDRPIVLLVEYFDHLKTEDQFTYAHLVNGVGGISELHARSVLIGGLIMSKPGRVQQGIFVCHPCVELTGITKTKTVDDFQSVCQNSFRFLVEQFNFRHDANNAAEPSNPYQYCLTNGQLTLLVKGIDYGDHADVRLNDQEGIPVPVISLVPGSEISFCFGEEAEAHRAMTQDEQIAKAADILKQHGKYILKGDLTRFRSIVESRKRIAKILSEMSGVDFTP
jgi:hypothetical protein